LGTTERSDAVERDVVWTRLDEPGAEHLRLRVDHRGVAADGLVVGIDEGAPFRARYLVRCDVAWRARALRVTAPGSNRPALHLRADGEGRWTTRDGRPLPELAGCIDLDLTVTPFTNTLPIRRLGPRPGESRDLPVAYVDVPRLALEPARQRYERLPDGPSGPRYRFEALGTGFTADLTVDADGLVLDYPGLFRRR
jgi:hypothetical protein